MFEIRKELLQRAAMAGRGCCIAKKMLYNKLTHPVLLIFSLNSVLGNGRGDVEKQKYHLQLHLLCRSEL